MKFPRLEREMIEEWVDGIESNLRWRKRGDLRNRQGSLLGGLLNGGNSLLGNLLGGNNRSTTTTTTEQPPPTTAAPVVSNPPATTAAPAPTQAQPTTQAPAPTIAPPTFAPPAQVTTAPAPTFQQPAPTFQQPAPVVSSSTTTQVIRPSTIPIAIPVVTTALLVPTAFPGAGDEDATSSSTALLPTFALPPPNLSPSSITTAGPVYPTTFATSVRSPSTNTLVEDTTTANPIMGGGMSGMGGISKMTIIISVVAIIFGVLVMFLGCWFLSQKYIRKRKITIALDMRISQLQAGDGPLPPVPMREKMKNEAMVFMMKFPRPPSLKTMRNGRQGGFEVIR